MKTTLALMLAGALAALYFGFFSNPPEGELHRAARESAAALNEANNLIP